MTETLNRPPQPSPRPARRPDVEAAHRSSAGAAAALWAAAAGLLFLVLPVLLVWAVDSRSGVPAVEALRSAGRLWLVAHGASLDVPGGRVALTPLGLMLLPLAILARFAASAARNARPSTTGAAARLALWVAGPYALLALLVAVLCSGPDVHVSPAQSLVSGGLVGAAGAAIGVLRLERLWRAAWHGRSARTRRLSVACAGATILLLGAGALLVGGSLVAHFPRAAELAGAADPGPVGGAGLLLAGLALVPNAVLWGVGWLVGPGFAVGVGTAVGPFAHELGPVPALPLLAALPGGAVPGWVGVLVLAVPLLAGGLAGRGVAAGLAAASDGATFTWRRTVTEAAPVGPLCGLVVGILAWLSGGAVGGDRLVEVGPSAWSVALAVTASVGVGAVAGALLHRVRRR
jgi:hypothetical protein